MESPTPYSDLNAVLIELVRGVRHALDGNFVAAYLQGSFAVGDFDDYSDVDFVVAIDRELSAAQLRALQELHGRIFNMDTEWAKHLEGSYFPTAVLRDHTETDRKLWYLDHGSRVLEEPGHCNTVVVRSILRDKGVVLAGLAPSQLIDPIPTEALRVDVRDTIIREGCDILAKPETIDNRFYQTFTVLNFCRMLHDLQAGVAASKRSGADWAKNTLDGSWAGIIDRAWDGRPDPAKSVRQPANVDDLRRTIELVREVMRLADRIAAAEN